MKVRNKSRAACRIRCLWRLSLGTFLRIAMAVPPGCVRQILIASSAGESAATWVRNGMRKVTKAPPSGAFVKEI